MDREEIQEILAKRRAACDEQKEREAKRLRIKRASDEELLACMRQLLFRNGGEITFSQISEDSQLRGFLDGRLKRLLKLITTYNRSSKKWELNKEWI